MVNASVAAAKGAHTNDCYTDWTSVMQPVIFSDSGKSGKAYDLPWSKVMSRLFGLAMVVLVAGVGGYIYMRQTQSATVNGAGSPQGSVDFVAVRRDLMSIAQAERMHNSLHGGYGTLDELRSSGDLRMSDSRGPYTYAVEVSGSSFRATATYGGPDGSAAKTISIDQDMRLSQE